MVMSFGILTPSSPHKRSAAGPYGHSRLNATSIRLTSRARAVPDCSRPTKTYNSYASYARGWPDGVQGSHTQRISKDSGTGCPTGGCSADRMASLSFAVGADNLPEQPRVSGTIWQDGAGFAPRCFPPFLDQRSGRHRVPPGDNASAYFLHTCKTGVSGLALEASPVWLSSGSRSESGPSLLLAARQGRSRLCTVLTDGKDPR
jgi:hypothetical protein